VKRKISDGKRKIKKQRGDSSYLFREERIQYASNCGAFLMDLERYYKDFSLLASITSLYFIQV
jgi:hypothetical protein